MTHTPDKTTDEERSHETPKRKSKRPPSPEQRVQQLLSELAGVKDQLFVAQSERDELRKQRDTYRSTLAVLNSIEQRRKRSSAKRVARKGIVEAVRQKRADSKDGNQSGAQSEGAP